MSHLLKKTVTNISYTPVLNYAVRNHAVPKQKDICSMYRWPWDFPWDFPWPWQRRKYPPCPYGCETQGICWMMYLKQIK